MRSIGIKDVNGNDIFEGDTVTFSSNEVYLAKEWIDALNIDLVTAYIIPQNGKAGSQIEYHFFSNGKEVNTYDQKYNILLEMHKDDEKTIQNIHDWFNELDLDTSSVIPTRTSEKDNALLFTHEFIHQEKTITETSDDKDKNFDVEELVLSVGGKEYSVYQSFKVKLTEEQKASVLEIHNSLYEFESFVGDFSHIIFTPKDVTLTSHSFKTVAVDENGECTLYGIQESPEKQNREMTRILEPIREDDKRWREENEEKLSKEEFDKAWEQRRIHYKDTLAELKKQTYKDEFLIDDIFLGFGVSDQVLQHFYENGCEVTPI